MAYCIIPVNTVDRFLVHGLDLLLQNDTNVERLVAPRREAVLSLLSAYISEIEHFNPAYALVGTNDRQELVIKHILDSLAPLGVISRLAADRPHIADVGSGAGLPGIPLAIAMPQVNVTLIERMGRRAEFLRNTVAALELSNVHVEQAQVEEIARRPKEAGCFAVVTFRAFKPLEPKLLKRLLKLCIMGGFLAAYKGRMEKIREEMKTLERFPCRWEAIPYPVPLLNEERHLLLINNSCSEARTRENGLVRQPG